MPIPLFTNNAATALAVAITPTDTVLQITAGTGSEFPSPTGGNYFMLTLVQINNPEVSEIVKCINRTGDYLTVERGQENTQPQIFNISDNVQLRITAQSLNIFAQGGGGGGGGTAATQVAEFTATQGQTVFTIPFSYVPDNYNLAVFVNGSKQIIDVNYSESSSTSITFFTGLNVGDLVEVVYNLPIAAGQIDASNILYDQGGVGAVESTVQKKLQESVSVKDFGAVGDGTTDDTVAIQNAINAALALRMSGNSGIYGPGTFYVGTAPTVHFPSGVYKISGALTPDTVEYINYMNFVGENSIIVPTTSTFTIFGGIGYQTNFTGLTFRGGDVAISIKTNNADADTINIIDCEFAVQKTASIQSDANSNSTILTIERCKFMQTDSTITAGYSLYMLSGDYICVNNCWFSSYTPNPIYNGIGSSMFLTNCLGVPGGSLNHWITNYGNLNVTTFRFGGEDGGHTFVYNYADTQPSTTGPTYLKIIDCPWAEAINPNYVVKFFKLPNVIELTGIDGLISGNQGLYYDSSMTYVNFALFQTYGQVTINNNLQYGAKIQYGTNDTAIGHLGAKVINAMLCRDSYQLPVYRDRIDPSELCGSGGFSNAWTYTQTNATVAYTADNYGVVNAVCTAGADNANVSLNFNNLLAYSSLLYEVPYTFNIVVNVVTAEPTAGLVEVFINIGSSAKAFSLGRGTHLLSIPFVYLNGTGSPSNTYGLDQCQISVNMQLYGDIVSLGRQTLVEGMAQYTKPNLTLQSSGIPAAMTAGLATNVGYYKGDIDWVYSPTSGAPPGYVCTVSGNAGTWKAMANLA